MTYQPSDFQPPSISPYIDTLGKSEWEYIAAHIIRESQKAGTWTPVKDFSALQINDLDIREMIHVGKLVETKEGYMLTNDTLEEIAKKYSFK